MREGAGGRPQGCCRDIKGMPQGGCCREVGGVPEGCCRDMGDAAGGMLQDTFPRLSDKQRVSGSHVDSN